MGACSAKETEFEPMSPMGLRHRRQLRRAYPPQARTKSLSSTSSSLSSSIHAGAVTSQYVKDVATMLGGTKSCGHHENRDLVVVVDRSGSMNAGDVSSATGQRCRRWDNVGMAVQTLVAQRTELDEDGIDLYLFSTGFDKFENVDSAEKVTTIFEENEPKGSTDLAGVLEAAFQDHFAKDKNRPTTVLVITDGEPNSGSAVVKSICNASDRCRSQTELSITFVQVGDDARASRFMRKLDSKFSSPRDIVNTLKSDCFQSW